MSKRFALIATGLLALSLAAPAPAWAQKTKSKTEAPAATQPEGNMAVPTDPEALNAILDEADALYFVEPGQEPDYKRAFELYSLAAESGDAYAMNIVGLMYDNGEFVAVDYAKAFEWYLKAAELGHPTAQGNVASMYSTGDGVRKNPTEALYWYREAAANGYARAMYALGNLYLSGEGVTKDSEEAAAWFQKASDAGNADAHWSLSLRYLYGDGVGKDTQKAAELAYLAIINGVQVAKDELAEIRTADTSPNYRSALQSMLKRDGFYTGAIDASFGPATQRAIAAAFGSAL